MNVNGFVKHTHTHTYKQRNTSWIYHGKTENEHSNSQKNIFQNIFFSLAPNILFFIFPFCFCLFLFVFSGYLNKNPYLIYIQKKLKL